MANTYLKALQERGHNPNLIVVTQPVKRDKSLKELLNLTQTQKRSNHPESTLKQSTNIRRMPLRMLVSQKAERTPTAIGNGPFKSKHLERVRLSIPPYNMTSDISSCRDIPKRQSQRSVNASVRMLLQNPYVTKLRSSSSENPLNNNHNITNILDLKPSLFHSKNIVNSKDQKEHNLTHKAQVTQNVNQTYIPSYITEQINEGITECGNDNSLESFPYQKQKVKKLIDKKKEAIEVTFNYQDIDTSPLRTVCKENSETNNGATINNSPMSVLSSSEKIEGESFGFIWTPVQCSSSNIDECNFLEEIDITENFTFSFSNLDNS